MRLTWIAASTAALLCFQAQAGIEQQLAQCASLSDKLDRLICYDELAAKVTHAKVTPTEAAVVAAAPVAKSVQADPVADFGADNLESTIQASKKNEVAKIFLTISKVGKDPYGALKISFSNGQVWKQTDSRNFRLESGQKVYIEKAALGSFLLGTEGRNSTIRVKRLQ
ncbi:MULTISPECIES: hypothetical protein [Shewanella]|uniref:hypothetical protein n=1 Tax=Shewanella TaxID=22 RepID=UPI001184272F|nr:hypothetical protein [Shewanella algae]EKT4487587.1 hypothetical protein [Shewanella algae]MBO2549581.1 hypothetical protein [Shewanella algae]TVO83670.1 hypothetical protein AYI78_13050 [Shewanella algae]TVO85216.1 hypothetical protein AYI76_08275 [Shewanella algae]TVO96971.1 hypothetical protein AYI79_07385 [Shewanella algae]